MINYLLRRCLKMNTGGGVKDLAPEILATFPASVRAAANAVYVSSGGGEDGIKAVKNYTDQLQDVKTRLLTCRKP